MTFPSSARRLLGRSLALLAAASPAGLAAQGIVTSRAPAGVEVTVYRNPHRYPGERLNLRWLSGFALVSERRRVSIPAGESELRFEGVAGGILPQSAIVTGLPEGIIERNRDAYLLSPGTLLDRSLGRRVHLRRTSPDTGKVRDEEAVIRSGADGAVVLQTEAGVETLRCTGLPETLVYDRVPAGLSAKPTLSIRTRARRAVTATVTLSYIATGFDWDANYIVSLSPDGTRADLFAWLTLASTDETSFVNADAQAVAGRLNWRGERAQPPESRPINLKCWPHSTTSDIPEEETDEGWGNLAPLPPPPPPPPPPSPPPPSAIAVSASRVARQEELGDLKLYRIPEPVTIASNGQKQVALLERRGVRVELVHRMALLAWDVRQASAVRRILVTRNVTGEGLGLPLPAGRVAAFAEVGGRPFLIGRDQMTDRAVGDDVELDLGAATGVTVAGVQLPATGKELAFELVAANNGPRPVRFEAEIQAGGRSVLSETPLGRRAGNPLWSVTLPANGRATLRYRFPIEG